MPCRPAENIGVDRLFVFFILLVDAGLQCDKAVFILIERRINRTRLRNELVQLVGQYCVSLPSLLQLLVRAADPLKQLFQEFVARGKRLV